MLVFDLILECWARFQQCKVLGMPQTSIDLCSDPGYPEDWQGLRIHLRKFLRDRLYLVLKGQWGQMLYWVAQDSNPFLGPSQSAPYFLVARGGFLCLYWFCFSSYKNWYILLATGILLWILGSLFSQLNTKEQYGKEIQYIGFDIRVISERPLSKFSCATLDKLYNFYLTQNFLIRATPGSAGHALHAHPCRVQHKPSDT